MKPFNELPPSVQEELKRGTRAVFVRTYATAESLENALEGKGLEAYAYILHDKDGCEPHLHVVMLADRSRRGKDMYAWLKDCVDSKGELANSEIEVVRSMDACHKYLTHSDDTSKQKGKHQYEEENIIYPMGGEPWDYKTPTDIQFQSKEKERASAEKCDQLIQDIIDRVPAREMARRYGRDYMKNHMVYRKFAAEVLLEEGGDFEKAFALTDSALDGRVHREITHAFDLGGQETILQIRQMVAQGYAYHEAVNEISKRRDFYAK